jgi:hypothetical protein
MRLLVGLLDLCNPMHLEKNCQDALAVYGLAFKALTSIAEHAAAQKTSEGKAVALNILNQLQPENHKQAPGVP